MKGTLHRTQLLLDPEQHRILTEIAQLEGRSLSDVVRGMLDAQLALRQQDATARKQRRLQGLERIRRNRQLMLDRRGGAPIEVDLAELVSQMREARDEELTRYAASNRD